MEQFEINLKTDTIAAISTPPGKGGIAVVRVSGPDAIKIIGKAWKGARLENVPSHTAHLGSYIEKNGNLLDEALVTVFKAPNSFTGEDVAEISVHGSTWIQNELLNDLIKRGARIANPGEFTQRAFMNGKLDLAQAEGVADLIAASSKASHDLAINQTKGNFSKEFNRLRDKLIEFASLMELELDFSEEDVEFADRNNLLALCDEISDKINKLADSYSRGSVLKNGVPVVIAGIPNAGKSSILNLLADEEKAIVTDIPGTTRDLIEVTNEYNGICFRFIDTAGLRETADKVEEIGVEKAFDSMSKAFIIIWVLDRTQDITNQLHQLTLFKKNNPDKHLIILLNKVDIPVDFNDTNPESDPIQSRYGLNGAISFSTVTLQGQKTLMERMCQMATDGQDIEKDVIVTNARHYEALTKASKALSLVRQGIINGLPTDLITQDLREAITHLSFITGTITTDNLLHSIFSHFCIGK